jgi:hypothetical protein
MQMIPFSGVPAGAVAGGLTDKKGMTGGHAKKNTAMRKHRSVLR